MLRLCLVGGLGRMGRAVASLAGREEGLRVVSVLESAEALESAGGPGCGPADGGPGEPPIMTADPRPALEACDVALDFSLPQGFSLLLEGLGRTPRPLVTGTTGIDDKDARLAGLAGKVAVVSAPNMSVGVNMLFALSGLVAGLAGEASDVEIIETHHRGKKDVPSGTALEIARRIGRVTGRPVVVGRRKGPETRGDGIYIHSLRMGGVAGEHTVAFSLEGEVLKMEHAALSRECFAAGALRAARFAAAAPPGLYSMLDVLGLKSLER